MDDPKQTCTFTVYRQSTKEPTSKRVGFPPGDLQLVGILAETWNVITVRPSKEEPIVTWSHMVCSWRTYGWPKRGWYRVSDEKKLNRKAISLQY